MWRDMERLTHKYGLPWQKPSLFPRSSTLAARVACSITGQPWCGAYICSVFAANFGEDRDIGDERVVGAILDELGKASVDILATAVSPERKGLLRANTSQAVDLGIFGAPNCIVRGELFWGEETLEDAVAWALADHA